MAEIIDGVFEHKTLSETWLSINTYYFLPSADWMELWISRFKKIEVYPSKYSSGLLIRGSNA